MSTQLAKIAALADPPSMSLDVSSLKRVTATFRERRPREEDVVKSIPKEVVHGRAQSGRSSMRRDKPNG